MSHQFVGSFMCTSFTLHTHHYHLTQKILGSSFSETAELMVDVDDCQNVYNRQHDAISTLDIEKRQQVI